MCFPMEAAVEKKWEFNGLQCVVTRADLSGERKWSMHRCGYVRVPAGHNWHGMDYDDIPVADVHGGLTFAAVEPCQHEDGIGYWIGFDCAHSGDRRVPHDFTATDDLTSRMVAYESPDDHYWTLDEVVVETEHLAKQVLEARNPGAAHEGE